MRFVKNMERYERRSRELLLFVDVTDDKSPSTDANRATRHFSSYEKNKYKPCRSYLHLQVITYLFPHPWCLILEYSLCFYFYVPVMDLFIVNHNYRWISH